MKKILLLVLAALLLLGITGQAYAAQEIGLYLDDEKLIFDSPPVIYQGRTLVPVRKLVESMGGDVNWNPNNRTVTIVKDKTTVVLVIDSKLAKVNETDKILDVPAMIIKGRTMIPARFVSENLGAEVIWDDKARVVRVKSFVNIDEEAVALLAKSFEKSKDIKKAKVDIKGSFSASGTSFGVPENIKFDMVGTIKIDMEEPAFSYAGKVTLHDGVVSQDLNLEMIMKDNAMYLMDPFTGEWSKTEIPEEDADALKQAIEQSSGMAIDYESLLAIAKETGVIRNVSFAGDKELNGKKLTGIYVELNGLKIGKFIEKAFADQEIDPLLQENFEEVWSQISVNKIKLTYWIDPESNIAYGSDTEFRMQISIPDMEEEGEVTLEYDMEMIYSDINKDQSITAPEVSEETDFLLPL